MWHGKVVTIAATHAAAMYLFDFAQPQELLGDGFHTGILRHNADKCLVVSEHIPPREPTISFEAFFIFAKRSNVSTTIVAHHPIWVRSRCLPDEVPASSTDCWVHNITPQEPPVAPVDKSFGIAAPHEACVFVVHNPALSVHDCPRRLT